MSVFKCKMCGGTLDIQNNESIATCEYCGSKQTLPQAKDEVIQNLFNRANTLRLKCEFDKAEQIYEKILQQDDTDAEAHWGIILCKYGIEYVEDPKTFNRIPTCHRTSYDAITADADYIAAIENADMVSKSIYAEEAKVIDEIQNKILSVVKNEKPFDVFICYKETDETGKRTIDSAIANDIYYQLTQEGLKVFYAAITLEDKIGQEYEPYIFAALSSAKVMLVIGTKPEYFNAVWVKNEWSRYIKQMKNDRSRLLIPCYKDMDAYELPEEFAHLQAQDISKIGFINDIVRGIKKVIDVNEPKTETIVKETVVTNSNSNIAPLLKRAFMFLEDGDWNSANEYCEKVLDLDPENAQAYLGKLMAELQVKTQDKLKNCRDPFDKNDNYKKVLRFGDEALKAYLIEQKDNIIERKRRNIYNKAVSDYQNALEREAKCNQSNDFYDSSYFENIQAKFSEAYRLFSAIKGYKDADELQKECVTHKENIQKEMFERAERQRKESERLAEEERNAQIRKRTYIFIGIALIALAFCVYRIVQNHQRLSAVEQNIVGQTFSDTEGSVFMSGRSYERTVVTIVDGDSLKYTCGDYSFNTSSLSWTKKSLYQENVSKNYELSISFFGKVKIIINGKAYVVSVRDDNTVSGITFYDD